MGISNSKRPQHIENKLLKSDTENVLNHLSVLKELSDNCPVINNFIEPVNLNSFLASSNPLLNSTQKTLSCLTKKALKENAEESEEKLFYGERNLQKVFTPIRALSKSTYSIATIVGYKGSDPYAVLKFGGLREDTFEDEAILHEIVVGLILNNLRNKTPGFMYTYGGFYCSPPVKIHELFKLKDLHLKKVIDTEINFLPPRVITHDMRNKREIQFNYDDDDNIIGDELESYEQALNNPDYFVNYFMYNYYEGLFAVKFLKDNGNQTFQEFKNTVIPIYETLLKSKYFRTKEKYNDEKFNHFKELIQEKINFINNLSAAEISDAKKIYSSTFEPTFEPEHFCRSEEDKTTLVLLEFINNSISQGDFLERNDISQEDFIKVRLQIILSLFIAFREYKFLAFDLHTENILIRIFDKPQKIKYFLQLYNDDKQDYEAIEYEMECKYVSQIIDFGDTYLEYNNVALPSFFGKRINNITDLRLLDTITGSYNEINNNNKFKKIINKLTEEYEDYNVLSKEEKQNSSFKNFKLDNFIRSLLM